MASAKSANPPKKIIAGDAAILARRYASALYELANEQKQLDAVASDLNSLVKLLAESPEFHAVAFDPRFTRSQMMDVAKKVSTMADLNKITASFIGLLAKNRRLDLLNGMSDAYHDELSAQRGEVTAAVRTAYPLTPSQNEKLTQQLQTLAGGKVRISVSEDLSLLGGIVVKLGSQLIDASVKGRLERLERQLKSNIT